MRIGIIGGGQLGRMMALAGFPLGHRFKIWTDSRDLATSEIAEQVIGPFDDSRLVSPFCEGLDAVTYEWENVPIALAKEIAQRVPSFFPSVSVLELIQDRHEQKSFFQKLKLPTALFFPIQSVNDIQSALKNLKSQAILKTCRMGYDGKGQAKIKTERDASLAWEKLGDQSLILEKLIKFEMELSLVAVRSTRGEMKFYSLTENFHRDGILQTSFSPARLPAARLKRLQNEAENMAKIIFKELNYVGVMTIEFFLYQNKLVINELASRVHNSGHWTIEGAATSQFENHLRAGLGLPLGSTQRIDHCAMLNILGRFPDFHKILQGEDCHIHHYGKTEAPHRKIGHITVRAKSVQDVQKKAKKIQQILQKLA